MMIYNFINKFIDQLYGDSPKQSGNESKNIISFISLKNNSIFYKDGNKQIAFKYK